MRIAITLDDRLAADLKKKAVEQGSTISNVTAQGSSP